MSNLPELPERVYAFAWVDHNGVNRVAMLFDKDARPRGRDDAPVAEYIRSDLVFLFASDLEPPAETENE